MSVLSVVRREAARLRRLGFIPRVLLPIALLLGALSAAAGWFDGGRWLTLPAATPLLVWVAAIAAAVGFGAFLALRLGRRASPHHVAESIETEQGMRRGALTGLLEVAHTGIFAEHAAELLGAQLREATRLPAPRLRRRILRAALLSLFAFAQIFTLASSSWARRPDGWSALLHPIEAWRGALVAPLRIADAPERAMRGSAIDLGIEAPGRRVVQMRWRATGGGWQQEMLLVDSTGRAALRIPSADADLVVLASDGRAGSDSIAIRVVDRPFVGNVTVLAEYPAYLERARERLPSDASLRIPAGTRLSIEGNASEPLAAVALRGETARVAMVADGSHFRGAFTPRGRDIYAWDVTSAAQPILDVPPPLDIEVLPDSAPHAEILSPTGELLVEPDVAVLLDLLAQDDNGLTGVWLRLRKSGSESAPREIRLSDGRDALWSGSAAADLRPFRLQPGDAVEVQLVARDAAPGGREGLSAPLTLRVPTADQARAAARAAADAAVGAAEAAAAAQAALAEQTANEARTRADRGANAENRDAPPNAQGQQQGAQNAQPNANAPREGLNYDSAERARDIAERQRQMANQVEQLEDAARELEDRLRSAGALDSSLARQLQDAQRMLRDAMTPEMMAAMENLEQSTQELDGQRTRQSMQQLAEQQRRLRETLEKSAEMLKRAAMEGQMQTVADQSRDLAERQRQMADSAQSRPPSPDQAQQMQREASDLAKMAQQLAERLQQAGAQTGAQQMQQGAEQAQQSAQQMQQAGQDPNAAAQAAQSMEKAADAMSDARRQQVGEWKAELTEALDRSVQEMLQMAREQDALADQARGEQDASQMRGAQSALQQGVQAAQQRLEEESRRSTLVTPRTQELMDRAEQRAAQATRDAAEGRRGQTEQAMREAADALRQAAAQLTRDRERAGSARSATGIAELLEQLQQLAQQQGGLNNQMLSLLPMAQRQGGASQMDAATREQARQLARAQRDVARQLDDVADADPTGRAEEMAREARALALALDQGAVDPATQARQERLFRRMLDAGRSLEQDQRDESARREARAARTTERLRPSGDGKGEPGERYAVPSWDELRGLSAEDRRLVIEYFRRLNAAATAGRP